MGLSWKEQSLKRKAEQALDPSGGRDIAKRRQYDSRSAKVHWDRYNSARRSLMADIERYVEGRRRGVTDCWFYSRVRRHDFSADRYRKARAQMRARGLL